MKKKCQHKRMKKNFPFGRNSKPLRSCKDCGSVVSNHELKKRKKRRF